MYGFREQDIIDEIAVSVNLELPLIVGEFSQMHGSCDEDEITVFSSPGRIGGSIGKSGGMLSNKIKIRSQFPTPDSGMLGDILHRIFSTNINIR